KGHVRFAPNSDRESAFRQTVMSALTPKADMCGAARDVRYGPKADIASFMNARFNSKADMGNSRKRAERTLRMQRLRRRQQRPHSMHRDRLFDAPRQRMTTA